MFKLACFSEIIKNFYKIKQRDMRKAYFIGPDIAKNVLQAFGADAKGRKICDRKIEMFGGKNFFKVNIIEAKYPFSFNKRSKLAPCDIAPQALAEYPA